MGWRHRLFSVGEGALVLPLEPRPEDPTLTLVGIAETPVRAIQIPLDQVTDQLRNHGISLSGALDPWVRGFSALIGSMSGVDRSTGVSERIPPEGQVSVALGTRLDLSKDTTVLLKAVSGKIGLAGLPDIRLDPESGVMPIASGVVIEAITEQCGFEVHPVSELEYTGLTSFKRLVRAYLEHYEQYLDHQDQTHQSLADEMDRRGLEQALGEVGQLLSDIRVPARQRRTELLTAMTLIGEHLGVKLREPARAGEEANLDIELQAIVDLSDLRMRNVLLNDGWWKSDCGPLLGFLGEERRPAALIRDSLPAHTVSSIRSR